MFGLKCSAGPLFALVSRMVLQNGIDLVVETASSILAEGGQVVAAGQGEPHLEHALTQLAERYPGSVDAHIGFDETLARRMYAGSDFLLMPSRYEPCGLSQMYAQRFGSLPTAHRTGGLVDTIQDNVTGFLFEKASVHALGDAIQRAFKVFRSNNKIEWMKAAAMRRPSGWCTPASSYQQIYNEAVLAPSGAS